MNAPFPPLAVRLREADLGDAGECLRIERYVAAHGDGTPFHRPAWLQGTARGTSNEAAVLLAERHGEIAGLIPLLDVQSPLFGRALVSSGFGVGGGLLADGPGDARALLAGVEELAARRSISTVELRGGLMPDGRAGWRVRHDSHCGFAAPLAADDEAQLLWIPRKQRAEVRKGLAEDLTVEIGRDEAARAAHYAVYAQSVRNLGTPVFPRSLFAEVLESFGEDADILTIRHRGLAVASVLSLYHRGTVMPYWGGGVFAARQLRANDRMYYELMLHARRRGCTRFDFGRSKTGSGPYAFKRNWGFEPEPLGYASWTAPGAEPRDADPTSHKHQALIALWKRLPLPLANAVGPLIARGLG